MAIMPYCAEFRLFVRDSTAIELFSFGVKTMTDFKSRQDREKMVIILKTVNPSLVTKYGPLLDEWLAKHGSLSHFVSILKMINPSTVMTYGPLLDAWLMKVFDRLQLVQILKAVNPITVTTYGPLLDEWAKG